MTENMTQCNLFYSQTAVLTTEKCIYLLKNNKVILKLVIIKFKNSSFFSSAFFSAS